MSLQARYNLVGNCLKRSDTFVLLWGKAFTLAKLNKNMWLHAQNCPWICTYLTENPNFELPLNPREENPSKAWAICNQESLYREIEMVYANPKVIVARLSSFPNIFRFWTSVLYLIFVLMSEIVLKWETKLTIRKRSKTADCVHNTVSTCIFCFQKHNVLYISTSIWVLHNPNAGRNMLFQHFSANKLNK